MRAIFLLSLIALAGCADVVHTVNQGTRRGAAINDEQRKQAIEANKAAKAAHKDCTATDGPGNTVYVDCY